MRVALVKRWVLGARMPLAQARHERLGKAVALAVFASDPLSSVAYATEEILLVLALAGSAAFSYSLPIAGGIATLLAIVVVSYRQTVTAYPQGGGAYLVAKDNLGIYPALGAAAALLTAGTSSSSVIPKSRKCITFAGLYLLRKKRPLTRNASIATNSGSLRSTFPPCWHWLASAWTRMK